MSAEDCKKFKTECIVCKAKFDIWVSMSNFRLEQEKIVRQNFYYHCPVCKTIEQIGG